MESGPAEDGGYFEVVNISVRGRSRTWHRAGMTVALRVVRALAPADVDGLAALLVDATAGGASVGFLAGFDPASARAFWAGLAAAVAAGDRLILVAQDDQGIVGTAHLILTQPPNQPHRADVSKVLVLRRCRGRGIGSMLMRAVEAQARAAGRTLLMLDTTAGQPAERMYERLGWTRYGTVPGHALMPDGSPSDTTFFYKELGPGPTIPEWTLTPGDP